MGERELQLNHIGLLKPYDIVKTAGGTVVAEFFFTSESLLS